MADLTEIRRTALRSLIPPPKLRLSEWAEAHIHLPSDIAATPGRLRMLPYLVAVADAISDPTVEKITLVKGSRLGFSTLLVAVIGSFCVNEPCPVLVVLPVESDCRGYVVDDIEGIFAASPALRGLLSGDCGEEGERNTLTHRKFPGGSLRVVAARAPRNLRRVAARILLCDEIDAYELTAEGSALRLAEKRTLTFANRKLIYGSTPIHEDTSAILQSYQQSDMRVFEICCIHCAHWFEILWSCIQWPHDRPEQAHCVCPSCGGVIEEKFKARLVSEGRWRATKESGPEGRKHAGFRLSALCSSLANASWGRLAQEFLEVRDQPENLQTFVNTILGQAWRSPGVELDETALASRAEPFGLNAIPEQCLFLTAGCDVQTDRPEISFVGWSRVGEAYALGHHVLWGPPSSDETIWLELDMLLKSKFPHPFGGQLTVDSCVIDSGYATDQCYAFAFPRMGRKVFSGKGQSGSHPALRMAKVNSKSAHGGRLALCGVDTVKSIIFDRLQHGKSIRFSQSVTEASADYFEQLCSERRVIRYSKGRPVRRFERKTAHARAESLDCLTYAGAPAASSRCRPTRARPACAIPQPQARRRPCSGAGSCSGMGGRKLVRSIFLSLFKGQTAGNFPAIGFSLLMSRPCLLWSRPYPFHGGGYAAHVARSARHYRDHRPHAQGSADAGTARPRVRPIVCVREPAIRAARLPRALAQRDAGEELPAQFRGAVDARVLGRVAACVFVRRGRPGHARAFRCG
jgi:phage terminase large subunit GpA-like protein